MNSQGAFIPLNPCARGSHVARTLTVGATIFPNIMVRATIFQWMT